MKTGIKGVNPAMGSIQVTFRYHKSEVLMHFLNSATDLSSFLYDTFFYMRSVVLPTKGPKPIMYCVRLSLL